MNAGLVSNLRTLNLRISSGRGAPHYVKPSPVNFVPRGAVWLYFYIMVRQPAGSHIPAGHLCLVQFHLKNAGLVSNLRISSS